MSIVIGVRKWAQLVGIVMAVGTPVGAYLALRRTPPESCMDSTQLISGKQKAVCGHPDHVLHAKNEYLGDITVDCVCPRKPDPHQRVTIDYGGKELWKSEQRNVVEFRPDLVDVKAIDTNPAWWGLHAGPAVILIDDAPIDALAFLEHAVEKLKKHDAGWGGSWSTIPGGDHNCVGVSMSLAFGSDNSIGCSTAASQGRKLVGGAENHTEPF